MVVSKVLKNSLFYQVTDTEFINLFSEIVSDGRPDVFKQSEFYDHLATVCKSDVSQSLNFNYSNVIEFDSLCDCIEYFLFKYP